MHGNVYCVDLQMVWMHGEKGDGLSQFYIPHSVAVDNFQRVGLQYIYIILIFQSFIHFTSCFWKSVEKL